MFLAQPQQQPTLLQFQSNSLINKDKLHEFIKTKPIQMNKLMKRSIKEELIYEIKGR